MKKQLKAPGRATGKALPQVAERKRHAVGEILQTVERLYKDRPYLAFFLVRGAINVLDERKTARPWLIGGSVTLGSGILAVAGKAAGFF